MEKTVTSPLRVPTTVLFCGKVCQDYHISTSRDGFYIDETHNNLKSWKHFSCANPVLDVTKNASHHVHS